MTLLYKVVFKYRDTNAPANEYGFLSSHIIEKKKKFCAESDIVEYASSHHVIVHRGSNLLLLYYVVEEYVFTKVNEYSVNVK